VLRKNISRRPIKGAKAAGGYAVGGYTVEGYGWNIILTNEENIKKFPV